MDARLREEVNNLHAQICAGLADPTRILILYALHSKSQFVSELAATLEMPQPTVSRHLKVLRERGMVKSKREGQAVVYSITDERIIQALDLLRMVLADMLKERGELSTHL